MGDCLRKGVLFMCHYHEETGHLHSHDGMKLFYRTWLPEQPIGTVVLVPGTNEHVGRYGHVGKYFAKRNLAVHAIDHRGHGQSEGTRCFVERFDHYLKDLGLLVDKASVAGRPSLIGHSLGGLIAHHYALAFPQTLSALVLSSPMFRIAVKGRAVERALLPVLSRLVPRLQVPSGIAPTKLSRDLAVGEAYMADPLVGKTVTPRWADECMARGLESLDPAQGNLQVPALFLQAGDDLLVDPEATRQVFEQVTHDRKAFKLYPGKYHEIFNDPGYEEVFADIFDWLRKEALLSGKDGGEKTGAPLGGGQP